MPTLEVPLHQTRILLHACCAPCSGAVIECLLQNGIEPVVFFFNPNIYPLEEYEVRKAEAKRYALQNELEFVDGDYDYAQWREAVRGLEDEPERGARCTSCFYMRLLEAARRTRQLGLQVFATTLASSRWKDLAQVNAAGERAAAEVGDVTFWAQNWRKGGLQERRSQLIRENNFYNQQYCGCEFSRAAAANHKKQQA